MHFLPDGTLARDVPYFDNRAIGGGVFGGLSATGLENAMLLPGLERFNGNVFLNGNISPAFKPSLKPAMFGSMPSSKIRSRPLSRRRLNPVFSTSNPFLERSGARLLQQFPATVATATCQARTGTTQCFQIQRFNNDLGTRAEDHKRDTYRVVVGTRGELSTSRQSQL